MSNSKMMFSNPLLEAAYQRRSFTKEKTKTERLVFERDGISLVCVATNSEIGLPG
jgi:hypothetical protein